MHRGYITLYRKIQDHPFYKEKRVFSKSEAWIDILMEVRHSLEPEDVVIGMNVINCGHGQSLNSLRTWAKRWGWTAKKCSRFFILLEKMEQIRHENVTVTTRITVLNYSKYDVKCHTDVTDMSHDRHTTDTQGKHDCPTDNNVKKENNEKNVNNYSDEIKNFTNNYQEYVLNAFPKTAPKITDSLIEKCNDTIDKLIRLDDFTFKEIYDSIQWASNDDFWSDQILSLGQLRKKGNNGNKKFVNLYTAYQKKDTQPSNAADKRTQSNLEALRRFTNE